MERQNVTVEDVIEMVKRLPADRLAVVYEFIAFVHARAEAGADDWLNDREETEDALWDAIAAQHADKRAQIEARIGASPALPMFDESGRWLVDDYTDADFEEQGRGRGA